MMLELFHLIFLLVLFLFLAHIVGVLFEWIGQPRMIGEIVAGLILGPTLMGYGLPVQHQAIFALPPWGGVALNALSQAGVLLQMFCSGVEVRSIFREGERKAALLITATGVIIPFALGYLTLDLMDASKLLGAAKDITAFNLIFGVALAVTSIPVISRIFFDLGILKSAFARTVLSAAILEDLLLYTILAIALSLVDYSALEFSLPHLLGFENNLETSIAWRLSSSVCFLIFSLAIGPNFFRRIEERRRQRTGGGDSIFLLLGVLAATVGVTMLFGITPIFGALGAGIVISSSENQESRAYKIIKSVGFKYFIPIYYVMVGLKIDLVHYLDLSLFVGFIAFASLVKILGVYLGGKLAGKPHWDALNLAIAMNARGGPGIILAVVSLRAAIINERFYTLLVMLSILTSIMAAIWLKYVLRNQWRLA
jgi:Kef-type K+ transport system membrane component KefB